MTSATGSTRRDFLAASAGTLAWIATRTAVHAQNPATSETPATPPRDRVLRLGLVGCGARGTMLADQFRRHGGFRISAVADYFPEVAGTCGEALGVEKAHCYAGLSGFKRVLETDVEAVVLEAPTFFLPGHVEAAIAAGRHVFVAAPVAVDVPGLLAFEAATRRAAGAKLAVCVDQQLFTEPVNAEVAKRIREGGLDPLAHAVTTGTSHGYPDPAKGPTIEDRLREQVWVNDVALGGDYVLNFDLPVFDAAARTLGRRPVAATGHSRICRPEPHGDSHDVCHVTFEYEGGLVLTHLGQAIRNNTEDALQAQFFGPKAYGQINYWGRSFLRGGPRHFGGGEVKNLYVSGPERNIASFYDAILGSKGGLVDAEAVIDAHLMAMLGREAASRNGRMTMPELLKESRRLEADLKGLKS